MTENIIMRSHFVEPRPIPIPIPIPVNLLGKNYYKSDTQTLKEEYN